MTKRIKPSTKSLEDELRRAAFNWWKGKRPMAYSLDDHLSNPEINTSTDRAKRLSRAVATLSKRRNGDPS